MQHGIGQPVTRTEDPRLLTGRGTYVDDITLPNQTYAAIVYSTIPHGNIKSIDTGAAEAAPGVLAVLTGADAEADGLGGFGPAFMPEDVGIPVPGHRTSRPVLAQGKVRHLGERVALVVAETLDQAIDATELVQVDYEGLPAVTTAVEAIKDGAPQVYDEAANNTSFALRMGNGEAVAAAFESAAHTVKVPIFNNRLTANSMEPRGSNASYDRASGETTLYVSTQNPHGVREELAGHIFHEHETNLRVVAKDVGGGFGMKGSVYPEEALVVWATRKVQRPVKWTPSRSESLMSDDQGRDQTVEAELALDAEGKILALRWMALNNVGAYICGACNVPVMFSLRLCQTVYAIPEIDVGTKAVFTNVPPTTPYRGAGRPEAVYIMERLMDTAAHEMGIDPVELRRKNLIASDAMPFTTHTHYVYDSGEFDATMTQCVDASDWDGFEKRRADSEANGRWRGRGLAYYIDDTGIFNDRMEMRFDPSGGLTIVAGTFSHGQGHETTYPQMVSDWLGVDADNIRFIQGDTAAVSFGRGSYASRSMIVGGSALKYAADEIIEKGKKFAAHVMEASPADIEFSDGNFVVAGTDKQMTMTEVAQWAYHPAGLPPELGVGLEGVGGFAATSPSFPNGCHISEVEIDQDTGKVTLDRFVAVDDMGIVMNPLLAHGQIQGGVAQGVGQALMEDLLYDPDSGQLLTGSFLDYCMPRADDLPSMEIEMNEVPCTSNPIGVKGAGEGGTVGATPAVIIAILDALRDKGVTDIPLPATPERIWQAVNNAKAA